jgi:hypothetical protein
LQLLASERDDIGRTWLDPHDLDSLLTPSHWNGAAFLIAGRHLIATTSYCDHLPMLAVAGMSHRQSRDTTDTNVFQEHFTADDIGLLYGNAGPGKAAIEFDVPDDPPLRKSNGIVAPALPSHVLASIVSYVRGHAGMRNAFPRGMQTRLHFRNYTEDIGAAGWVYEDSAFRHYGSEKSLCDELCRRVLH